YHPVTPETANDVFLLLSPVPNVSVAQNLGMHVVKAVIKWERCDTKGQGQRVQYLVYVFRVHVDREFNVEPFLVMHTTSHLLHLT
ncbi:MAG: hypothetical protein ACRDHP_05345, partial [Ktedonobacterales bacterium]